MHSFLLSGASQLFAQSIDWQEEFSLPTNILTDSSSDWNPDGIQPDGQWQYGYTQTPTDVDAFVQSHVWRTYFPGPNSWIGGEGEIWDSGGYPRLGKYAMSPSATKDAVKRWTSKVDGLVTLSVDCQQLQNSVNDQKFMLYRNGVLEADFRKADASHHVVFQQPCEVEVGDVLDFVIDSRGNSAADWTFVDVKIMSGDGTVQPSVFYFHLDEKNDLPVSLSPEGSIYDRRSRVADFSGNDNHGILVNMDRDQPSVEGVLDRGRFFDGVDDVVQLENMDIGDGLTEFTLSAWVRPESKANREGFVTSTGPDHFGFNFSESGEGLPVRFSAKGRGVESPDFTVPVGEWTHVVGVWEAGLVHRLYINGEEVASHPDPGSGVMDVDQWLLGSDRLRSNRWFHGALDEVRLLPEAINAWQIRDLYRKEAQFHGVSGPARYFDGVADFDLKPNEVQGVTEMTIAAWMNPYRKKDNAAIVSSSGEDYFALLQSGGGVGNPIEFRAKGRRLLGPDYSCPTGQWNHVAGVWKSGVIQKLYINGEEVADSPTVLSGAVDLEQWVIGRDRFINKRFYNGLLENVVIEPIAYTAEEVDALYRESLPADFSGPVEMKGHLRWDYVFGIQGDNLDSVVTNPAYYTNSYRGYHTGFHSSAYTGFIRNATSSTHLRGYIEAPESGEYYFWVTGGTAVDLSLSPDDQKYTKRVIAGLSPERGTSNGVDRRFVNLWDNFYSQLSEPIQLVEGERYYIDVLHNGGGVIQPFTGIAWARPNGSRELIPTEFMTPYVQEEGDRDDDFLPDAWELQYGLDPLDNGATDTAHQGEWGDFDEDGLRNREEYLAGTDPSNPDTDGDGLSDLAEQTVHNTNPIVSNSTFETVVQTISPSSVSGLGDSWVETGGGVLTSSFRGMGTWDFTVEEDGYYILQIDGQLRGNLRLEDILPVDILVNGKRIERAQMVFRNDQPAAVRSLSAWLPAGNHTLGLFIDNYTKRRTLEVIGIKVIKPGGMDANGDSLPDWVLDRLTQRSQVFSHPTFTYVSPAFIEGRSPSAELVDVSTITRSGQWDRVRRFNDFQWTNMLQGFENRLTNYERRLQKQMRQVVRHPDWNHHNEGRMEGTRSLHEPGAGLSKWFTKIPLNRNEAIGYVAQMEDLGIYQHGAIVWNPYNVLDGGELTIPIGSDLLVGAWESEWDWQQVTLTVGGIPETFPAADTRIHHFDQAGTYQISATHPAGASGVLTVHVRDANVPTGLAIGEQRFRDATLPLVRSDLALDVDNEFQIVNFEAHQSQGSRARFGGHTPGVYRLAARMSESGAILDQQQVNVVGVSDALRNGGVIATPAEDGNYLVHSPFLATYLPEGATIEVVIFAGGVTFPDGTTEKIYTVADLDEQGVISLNFLMPVERLGAPCHYITIYDADGTKIWNSTL